MVRALAVSVQGRRAARRAMGGPAGTLSRPVTALAHHKPKRPALPNPASVCGASAAPVPATPAAGRRPETRRSSAVVLLAVRALFPSPVIQSANPTACAVGLQAHGCTASAALQPCAATAPTRPLCAAPCGARSPAYFQVSQSRSLWLLGG